MVQAMPDGALFWMEITEYWFADARKKASDGDFASALRAARDLFLEHTGRSDCKFRVLVTIKTVTAYALEES